MLYDKERLFLSREQLAVPNYLTSSFISFFFNFSKYSQTEARQKYPFIEDIDLLEEVILIRNPSKLPYNISNWKISDDNGNNNLIFPNNTVIQSESILYVYCCVKGKNIDELKSSCVIWKNKDGSNRMKNVLNDGIR
jgi:hypothetical protein